MLADECARLLVGESVFVVCGMSREREKGGREREIWPILNGSLSDEVCITNAKKRGSHLTEGKSAMNTAPKTSSQWNCFELEAFLYFGECGISICSRFILVFPAIH